MLENSQIHKFNKRVTLTVNNPTININSTSMISKAYDNKQNFNLTNSNKFIGKNSQSILSKSLLVNSSIGLNNNNNYLDNSMYVKALPSVDSNFQINRLEQEILEVSHLYNYTKCRNNEKKLKIDKLRSSINNEINDLNSISTTCLSKEKELQKKKHDISKFTNVPDGKTIIIIL
jgi:hypothetical protein